MLFFAAGAAFAEHGDEVIVTGWLEKIVLSPWQVQLKAKLDTGAKTSSIHAEHVERFERDGKTWIRFTLPRGRKKTESRQKIETPLVRDVLIKRHKLPSAVRPVVEMAFCINDHYYVAEFTLADRGNFNYPVLLGRRFLANNILVDSSATFIYEIAGKFEKCESNTSEHVESAENEH
ncbi:MAG: ATP-dependent zinc protease family protein [Gammaproteobacteria bacterium]